jgi:GT2 family glycosyltransferase
VTERDHPSDAARHQTPAGVGVVAIGRNEGERLRRCIGSLPADIGVVVYVDSGSTDGSVEFAREHGAEVVELDMSRPFTAARARNAGVERLQCVRPDVPWVQFIDGDCELADGWLDAALEVLATDPGVAVVCGRRRELSPHETPYNQLCDMEWDTPVGEAEACGGDALVRLAALHEVGGYDETLIAGEEPEMCLRLRRAGYHIQRIDHEMTRHDAHMTRFSQWWLRNVRAGHAYAEGYHRHGRGPEAYNARAVRSNVAWGLALPVLSLGLSAPTFGGSFALLGLYRVLYRRVLRDRIARGDSPRQAALYARFTTLGKIPQAQGFLQFHHRRLTDGERKLIEYK